MANLISFPDRVRSGIRLYCCYSIYYYLDCNRALLGVEVSMMHGITIRLRSPNPSVPITIRKEVLFPFSLLPRNTILLIGLVYSSQYSDSFTCVQLQRSTLSTENTCVRNDVQAFGSVQVRKIRTQVKFAV